MPPTFDVFLSHNTRDKPIVRDLREQLKRLGLRVWLDETELVPGRPWQPALEEVLSSNVASVAVLVGSEGIGPWQAQEVPVVLAELVHREMPVIPVLLPGTPTKPELPPFLAQLTWVDLRDGLKMAGLDRLYWGITGRKPSTAAKARFRLQELKDLIARDDLRRAHLLFLDFLEQFTIDDERDLQAWRLAGELNKLINFNDPPTDINATEVRDRFLVLVAHLDAESSDIKDRTPIFSKTHDATSPNSSSLGSCESSSRSSEPMSPPIYHCKSLGKRFPDNRKFELSGIGLDILPGQITGVVGANSAGKTTLLRMIAGDLLPDTGEYIYPALQPRAATSVQIDWSLVRQQIAYVPQRPPKWYGRLGPMLHREAAIHGIHGKSNAERVDYAIRRLDLANYRSATWKTISGGYRMRFELAKSLTWRPKLLVLDEPLAPLDRDTLDEFLDDLRSFSNWDNWKPCIVVSSQHIYELEAVADQLLYLQDGRSKYCDSAAEVNQDRTVNTFEVTGNIDLAGLHDILRSQGCNCRQQGPSVFLITTPLFVSGNDLLSLLSKAGVHVTYFRDVSRSLRALFPSAILSLSELHS